ncbi:hypothetical protein VitviT2T_014096 [Vitis vinifera]|uniref:Uncharacterized protein n=1 Tax=Vitis vinifera TaxID=29760 RepID=A0ABY9CL31_VITVI|nr:hypothetical protein VitviT2T_014096 [Vitis vinifera]
MARTRGAKSSSPSNRKRIPQEAPVQGPTSEPPRPEAASPPAKPAPQNPPARPYLTRSGGRPLQKRARVQSSEPIDLTEQYPVLCEFRTSLEQLSSEGHIFLISAPNGRQFEALDS